MIAVEASDICRSALAYLNGILNNFLTSPALRAMNIVSIISELRAFKKHVELACSIGMGPAMESIFFLAGWVSLSNTQIYTITPF